MPINNNLLYFVFFLNLILLGCNSDSGITNNFTNKEIKIDRITPEIEFLVEELGIPQNLIVEGSEYFIIDGDMAMARNDISNRLNKFNSKNTADEDTSLTARRDISQAHTDNILNLTSSNNTIRVRIDASLNNYPGWINAFQEAVNNWSQDIPDASLSMQIITSGTADITIYNETSINLPLDFRNLSGVVARADLPSSDGSTGAFISINTSEFGSDVGGSSLGQLVATHELGHTIGFRHTNWQSNNEPNAIQIPRTPLTDSGSVMNSSGSAWNGFSPFDRIATAILYPDFLSAPQVTGLNQNGGFSTISTIEGNVTYGSFDYKIELYRKKDSGNWILTNTFTYPENWFQHTVSNSGNPTYYYRAKAISYSGKITSTFGPQSSITITGGGFGGF